MRELLDKIAVVRFSAAQLAEIDYLAWRSRTNRAEWIREATLEKKAREAPVTLVIEQEPAS